MMDQFLSQTRRLTARGMATNRPLALTTLVMLATIVAAIVGVIVDRQVITGAPAWLKPLKFALSISIYTATFVWLLGFVQGRRRAVSIVAWVTAGALLIEMALIALQVIRGTTSHFNVSTPFNGAVWSIMGISIVCLWTAGLALGFMLMRQHFADPAFAWALRFGVLISLVGMGVAFFMTSPTSAQLAAANAGHGLPTAGAHSVGVADGGPGLPILGWSTVGGDLRAPHFVGLHALQLLPLAGWLLARYGKRLTCGTRTALVIIMGFAYLGLVVILTWQALRGQSLVHPDTLTLAALAALIGVVALSVTSALRAARRATPAIYSVFRNSTRST